MSDFLAAPRDTRDLTATYRGVVGPGPDSTIVRMSVGDRTEREAVEIDCPIRGTTYSSHRCAPADLEAELARYLNLQWPAEHRLDAVRARADFGGGYEFGGDGESGLYVTEPPIRAVD